MASACKIELSISCRRLRDKDVFSKSDPMAVLFKKPTKNAKNWIEIGRTERISDNLNPDFQTKFMLDYVFSQYQLFKIALFDIDSQSQSLTPHDKLGQYEFALGEVVSRRQIEAPLNKSAGKNSSCVILTAIEMESSKEDVTVKLEATHLDNKDFLGKSDPFFEVRMWQYTVYYLLLLIRNFRLIQIFRADAPVPIESASSVKNYTLVYRSEIIPNNTNPRWKKFTLPLNRLCLGNKQLPLRIDCYDADSDGSRDYIGTVYTTCNQLFEQLGNTMMQGLRFHNEKKARKKGKSYKGSGNLIVKEMQFIQVLIVQLMYTS